MKRLLLLAAMMCISATAYADVKIKTKQTSSGQSTESTTYIKGKRTRNEMSGGMMITITQCDILRDLTLSPTTKTYTVTKYDDGSSTPAAPGQPGVSQPVTKGGTMTVTTTIKDTGERKQMFGFTARHIIQTIETETSPDSCNPTHSKMEMDMWVIDAEFSAVCSQPRNYSQYRGGKAGGCTDKIIPKTIGSAKSGYPLWQKMTGFDPSGRESFSMISEVVELSKTTLDAGLFEAPSYYTEVKDQAAMYQAMASSSSRSYSSSGNSYSSPESGSSSSFGNSVKNAANSASAENADSSLSPKAPGVIRIGLPAVRTGSVGDGINAAELSAAIRNSLPAYLKGTKVEIVDLEAKLASAQADEAKQKECDFIMTATASHKKGGGGFGFGKAFGSVVAQTGIGHTGSTIGNIAGQVATTTIVSATQVTGNVKSKDEMTLDIQIRSIAGNSTPLTRSFKAKAKSDGDDLISAILEQAAQAIVDSVGK